MNTAKTYVSKLKFEGLYIRAPINAKAFLSQNERDFFDVLIHLQSLKKLYVSDSLIMANSGLNSKQITDAKRNLEALGLIKIKYSSTKGTLYVIDTSKYESIIQQLNKIIDSFERFTYGDNLRREHGISPIFTNIINTLKRKSLKRQGLDDSEKIYALMPSKSSAKGLSEELEKIETACREQRIDRQTYLKIKDNLIKNSKHGKCNTEMSI